MPRCLIDHITVVANSLAEGAAFVENALGVSPQAGGEHLRMGTHNLLLRLGDSLFLEVIAVNPSGAPPSRPRWFNLDRLATGTPPRLAAWVARTDDIQASMKASPYSLGQVEPMSRGGLEWLISIPEDGSLPLDGALPVLIQWPRGIHPATSLLDLGLRLVKLEIMHPEPAKLSQLLSHLGVEDKVRVQASGEREAVSLVAHIETPGGLRKLSSPALPAATT